MEKTPLGTQANASHVGCIVRAVGGRCSTARHCPRRSFLGLREPVKAHDRPAVFLLADTRVVVHSAFMAPASRSKMSSSDQAPSILAAEQWGLGYLPGSG